MNQERHAHRDDTGTLFIERPQSAGRRGHTSERIEVHAERSIHKAFCGFEVVGVTIDSQRKRNDDDIFVKTDEIFQDRMMTSLVSALLPGQRVSFVYEGGGSSRLRWYIIGEASSTESGLQARDGLRNVRNALNTVLESRKRVFRYRPIDVNTARRTARLRGTWFGNVYPQGTRIDLGPASMGFGDAAKISKPRACGEVQLPHYIHDRSRAFTSIAKLLPSCRFATRVQISLEPCRLSKEQEAAVKSALAVVLNQHEDGTVSAHLEKAADIWLKSPSGCRLSCAVSSTARISDSFLRMLGSELYHGAVDVAVVRAMRGDKTSAAESSKSLGKSLDLRDAIPLSIPLPQLFPEPETLAQHGMRRYFNKGPITLPDAGPVLGSIDDGQKRQDVRLCEAQRNRHLYVLGATGTGKSTLLFNNAMQDIRNGAGICLIDPHGDLYEQVLCAIPARRAKDIVLLDPSERVRAVGLNLLECSGSHREMQMSFVINEVLAILNRLYDMKTCGGPMFEQYFRGALQLVMNDAAAPGTLVDVSAVFEYKAYRDSLIKKAGPSLLSDFWRMAERSGGEASLANIAPYIVSKLNAFVHNAMLRPIIGQTTSTIDFRQIMDDRRILLVNLSRGALGELGMQLLGTVILTKLICSAMSRLDTPPHLRTPFHVIVDEFQHFTTDATASLLSESRKFGLCLTLAHQNLSQLSTHESRDHLVHSVLGNVGSIVLFRLGAPDAEKLAVYTKPGFGPEDLQTLPNFHAASRVLTRSGPTAPFVFRTNPATRIRTSPTAQWQIAEARLRYTRTTAEIEEEIRKRREDIRSAGEARKVEEPKVKESAKDGVAV